MNFISKIIRQILIVVSIAYLLGCSREPRLWLYNFSDFAVTALYPGQQIAIDSGDASMLENWGASKNYLGRYNLKIKFAEAVVCYSLRQITVGGYGQYDESGNLVVRFRLDKTKKIHVYRIDGDFRAGNPVGAQPDGFPALPTACKDQVVRLLDSES